MGSSPIGCISHHAHSVQNKENKMSQDVNVTFLSKNTVEDKVTFSIDGMIYVNVTRTMRSENALSLCVDVNREMLDHLSDENRESMDFLVNFAIGKSMRITCYKESKELFSGVYLPHRLSPNPVLGNSFTFMQLI